MSDVIYTDPTGAEHEARLIVNNDQDGTARLEFTQEIPGHTTHRLMRYLEAEVPQAAVRWAPTMGAASRAGITCETIGQWMNLARRAERDGDLSTAGRCAAEALRVHEQWGHVPGHYRDDRPYAASEGTLERARALVAAAAEARADEEGALEELIGEEFTCHNQPYGTFTILVDTVGYYGGRPHITGTVVRGTETARLFQHSSTRDITGERHTVYGVRCYEILSRVATRASCG